MKLALLPHARGTSICPAFLCAAHPKRRHKVEVEDRGDGGKDEIGKVEIEKLSIDVFNPDRIRDVFPHRPVGTRCGHPCSRCCGIRGHA